ncbi:MAG TPA: hypothetical protein VF522_21835 [Ramlibacter sp.]|uniref:hypothetical protein n=1 Tax=Ramlibacter sp. TaxID=1917967 RepID=UPI002ED2DFE9
MKKTTLTRSLFLAGAVALAGAANADAIFYPNGTMVDLGSDTALEQMAMGDSTVLVGTCTTCVDTTTLGAGAATVGTATRTVSTPVVRYEYVQPNIDFDAATARAQMRTHRHVVSRAPAMVSDNSAIVVGSATIPYSEITVGQPYYVLSY